MQQLHLLCNAHLDPVWLWEWEKGAAEALSTFQTAADFCEAYDGFVFNHNEALLYQWVEEYEPELFSRIQRLVAAGRWHIMGGWFLQPDCNMPSGESFVRQILVGRAYFAKKFGVQPKKHGHQLRFIRPHPGSRADSEEGRLQHICLQDQPRPPARCPRTTSDGSVTTDRR